MVTKDNWLLRCSILINVAVILYIFSHVMIGGGGNFETGPGFIIQDEGNSNDKKRQVTSFNEYTNNNNNKRDNSGRNSRSGGGPSEDTIAKTREKEFISSNNDAESRKETSGDNNDVPTDLNEIATQAKIQIKIAGQPDTIESFLVDFVNDSNPDGYIASGDNLGFDDRLRLILKCHDRDYQPETLRHGDFWVLKNYIRAGHGELKCHETITYTTHSDYTFLDNLIPLLERWNSPVSIALHAPGNDFQPTINSIAYLRDCLPESTLVRQFVTFHIYFSTEHIPKNVPKSDQVEEYNCAIPPPFINITNGDLYKTQNKLLYPINVGRNIARDAAQTHFILASDIELYPNLGLVQKFLEMIARNDTFLQRKYPRVFALSIFEVENSVLVPKDKTELQELIRINKAITFHKFICPSCHTVPKSKEWMAANETEDLNIFHISKRVGDFAHWEPIHIGTHADPHYDERLSWEGKSDKMTQGYAMCVLNYEFHILDNAFLVHKPGIKENSDEEDNFFAFKTNKFINEIIYPELKIMYGIKKECPIAIR